MNGYEKWLGTFQSIRRWARVNVVPIGNEFQIEVQVYKELEDLERPADATAGAQAARASAAARAVRCMAGLPGDVPRS